MKAYHPETVAKHFDELSLGEWHRLTEKPADEVSLYLHTHYLKKHIAPHTRVLEIGAGAGRFTQILAERNVQIVVGDISAVQLELNEQQAQQLGFATAVETWHLMDICNMSALGDRTFNAIVAYGGPFSYVLDRRDDALSECLRLLKPGGKLLLSVMSQWGSAHRALESVLSLPAEINQRITTTGDITPATFPQRQGHFLHMFRAAELRAWLLQAELTICDLSASGVLAIGWDDQLAAVRKQASQWQELLRMELEASAEPGALDMGTHLIAVAQKNT